MPWITHAAVDLIRGAGVARIDIRERDEPPAAAGHESSERVVGGGARPS